MTDRHRHPRPQDALATLAAHHAECGTTSLAKRIATLLSASEPVLLDLSSEHGTITLAAHPYESERP